MAFVTCENCGQETSDKRGKCSKCGNPIRVFVEEGEQNENEKEKLRFWEVICVWIITFIVTRVVFIFIKSKCISFGPLSGWVSGAGRIQFCSDEDPIMYFLLFGSFTLCMLFLFYACVWGTIEYFKQIIKFFNQN